MNQIIINAKSVLKILHGAWHVERSISSVGIAKGRAICDLSNNDIFYREEVTLFLGNKQSLKAYKDYRYSFNPKLNQLTKYFAEENQVFYLMKFFPKSNIAIGKHLCMSDSYKSKYTFLSKNHFLLEYKAIGPDKDYTILSQYLRIL